MMVVLTDGSTTTEVTIEEIIIVIEILMDEAVAIEMENVAAAIDVNMMTEVGIAKIETETEIAPIAVLNEGGINFAEKIGGKAVMVNCSGE
jgi:hypothetical protein